MGKGKTINTCKWFEWDQTLISRVKKSNTSYETRECIDVMVYKEYDKLYKLSKNSDSNSKSTS